MIDLHRMYSECSGINSYIRVNSTHQNDIYVGYNNDMLKSIVVIGESKQKTIKSTNNIIAKISVRNDKRCSLEFSLQEEKYSSVFYKFCEDIIINTEFVQPERVITHTIGRWNVWRALFNKRHTDLLGVEQIKGLIGELLFLKNYMIKKYDIKKSIGAWTGPLGNPKDYQINDTWYEVKTINESRQSVKINSLEQLDSELEGYMVVIKLQNISNQSDDQININSLVSMIINLIDDVEDLEGFMTKLSYIGYQFDEEYDEYCFDYKITYYFKVNSEFPTIKRMSLSKSILKVTYELSLINLKEERIEKWK